MDNNRRKVIDDNRRIIVQLLHLFNNKFTTFNSFERRPVGMVPIDNDGDFYSSKMMNTDNSNSLYMLRSSTSRHPLKLVFDSVDSCSRWAAIRVIDDKLNSFGMFLSKIMRLLALIAVPDKRWNEM